VIEKFAEGGWSGFEQLPYKDVPGSHRGVVRQNLLKEGETQFEVRYFEIAPGGFTSFERHEHEHFVVVMCGAGEVRLGEDVRPLEQRDLVRVEPNMPHQFRNTGTEPFGILCVVDRMRDRPVLLGEAASATPEGVSARLT
jgi:quercetin dioxygenase-like cupin family protein